MHICHGLRFSAGLASLHSTPHYVHEVLVNRLGGLSLPKKSVVRLTDRPDMTLDVYRGRKTTTQHNKNDNQYLDAISMQFCTYV